MKKGAWSLLAIDVAAGAVTALLLGLAAWNVFLKDDGEGDTLQSVGRAIADAKADLANLHNALEAQKAMEIRHKDELAVTGAMPGQTPQEIHLRALSDLASANHLSVVRQLPLSAREYPGLLEQRFAYEVTGSTADLARFFKAVESAPGWTDISHLKIEKGKSAELTNDRDAMLTFSVFSMAKDQQSPVSKGG